MATGKMFTLWQRNNTKMISGIEKCEIYTFQTGLCDMKFLLITFYTSSV